MARDDGDVQVLGVPTESMSASLVRAEIDQQVSTAKAYPRSVQTFLEELGRLAAINETVADECIYAIPRKEDGKDKMIEGPSARFAELVLHAWGNCRAGARVVDEGPEFVTAQGFFHDLEGNVAISREVRRRITTKKGARFSADMIAVTANAACSIAQRNAVFAGVPKALWTAAYEAARAVVAGSAETFAKRRAKALDHLGKMGVPAERIFARLGISGANDMTTDHLVTLRGITAAIRDNEIDVDEAFPGATAPPAEQKPAGAAGLKAAVTATAPITKPAKGPDQKPVLAVTTEAIGAAPAPESPAGTANPDEPRANCVALGCTRESKVGSFYCEDHQHQTHPEPQAKK